MIGALKLRPMSNSPIPLSLLFVPPCALYPYGSLCRHSSLVRALCARVIRNVISRLVAGFFYHRSDDLRI
jgi:hypothetical protein